jgi:hypothetical protein
MKFKIKEVILWSNIWDLYELKLPTIIFDLQNLSYIYNKNKYKYLLKSDDNLQIMLKKNGESINEIDISSSLSDYIFFFANQLPYKSYSKDTIIDLSNNILIIPS